MAAAYDELSQRWRDDHFPPTDGIAQLSRGLAFLRGPGGACLNVGCGCNTRFNGRLREQGLTLEGVDISPRMVEAARAADPFATIHLADICDWPIPGKYAFILAWDSIWHVSLDAQRPLLLKLMAALNPGGVLLFTAGGLDGPAEHHDAFMGPTLYYASLGIPGMLQLLAEGQCVCRHLEFDQYPANHLVVIAQKVT